MTQTTELPMTETDSAAVRSRLYKLFALVFRYPTEEVYEAIRSGKFPDEVCVHIASLPHLETLENECRKMAREVKEYLESVPSRSTRRNSSRPSRSAPRRLLRAL